MNNIGITLIKLSATIAVVLLVLALQTLDQNYAEKAKNSACSSPSSPCHEAAEFLN